MGVYTNQGERRVSRAWYRRLLAAHISVSAAWLGVVLAKLVLAIVAIPSSAASAAALYLAIRVVDLVFPPLAVGTIITGVLLSLGTKWGLLQHYWVATKLLLTVGVIVSAVQLGSRLAQQISAAPGGPGADARTLLALVSAPAALLLALSLTHLLMLLLATVISVYKPWGRTRLGWRGVARR